MKSRILILILLFLNLNPITRAQDSIIINNHHSPKKAIVLSSLLPGAGQIYNKQIWKVPIIYAALGTTTGIAIYNYKGASKFKKEYSLRANQIQEGRNPKYINYPDQSIYNLYYAYEKNLELSIFIGIGVYLMNIVDAMVYGHLFEFDISPDITMNLQPYYLPFNPSLGLNTYPNSTLGLGMKISF